MSGDEDEDGVYEPHLVRSGEETERDVPELPETCVSPRAKRNPATFGFRHYDGQTKKRRTRSRG
jgi:hypothetical protein